MLYQIHETLSSWKTGVPEQKGQKLTAAVYSQFYQSHVGWIRQWREKPTRTEEWKKISSDLGKEAACVFHLIILLGLICLLIVLVISVTCGYEPSPTDLTVQFVVFDTD